MNGYSILCVYFTCIFYFNLCVFLHSTYPLCSLLNSFGRRGVLLKWYNLRMAKHKKGSHILILTVYPLISGPRRLFSFEVFRCGTYSRVALRRGRYLFQSERSYILIFYRVFTKNCKFIISINFKVNRYSNQS